MTLAIELLPASTDHVEPWPPIGRPCCGPRAHMLRDPVPPPSMLLGMHGIVTENRTAMNPALRGLGQCPCGCPYAGRCPFGFRGVGCCDSARRTAMSGLGVFPSELVSEATATARAWAAEYGLTLPPTPSDVIGALWRLAATERELELLRSKLRSMRGAGATLTSNDINAYKNAADSWHKAARETINPILDLIRRTSPAAALLIGSVPRPPGLDEPDRPLPYVPTEAEMGRIRSGDLSGLTGTFASMVGTVRGRLSGAGAMRGLGLFGIDDLTIGTLVLIVIGLLAIAAIVAAISIPSYALVQVLAAWVQARAAADVAERRRSFYERCLSSGSSSAECARQANATVPMPDPIPSPNVSLGVGGVVVGLAVAGAAYYFLATPGGRSRVGLSGVRRRRRR